MLGVSLSLLASWAKDFPDMTARKMAFLIRNNSSEPLLKFLAKSEGPGVIGEATHALCYHEDFLFSLSISVLRSVVLTKDVFVWIDIFCLDDFSLDSSAENMTRSIQTLQEVTHQVAETVVVFDSSEIHCNRVLSHQWCVLQMLYAIKLKKLTIALVTQQRKKLLDKLKSAPQMVVDSVYRVDSSKDATEKKIRSLFEHLNCKEEVEMRLFSWVGELAWTHISQLQENIERTNPSQEKSGGLCKALRQQAIYLNNVSMALASKGNASVFAIQLYEKVSRVHSNHRKQPEYERIAAINACNMGDILMDCKRTKEAICIFRAALEINRRLQPELVTDTMFELATALSESNENKEAESYFRDIVKSDRELFVEEMEKNSSDGKGVRCNNLITSLHNLGLQLFRMNEMVEAELVLTEAVHLGSSLSKHSAFDAGADMTLLIQFLLNNGSYPKAFDFCKQLLEAHDLWSAEGMSQSTILIDAFQEDMALTCLCISKMVDSGSEEFCKDAMIIARAKLDQDMRSFGQFHESIVLDLTILCRLEKQRGNDSGVNQLALNIVAIDQSLTRSRFAKGPKLELERLQMTRNEMFLKKLISSPSPNQNDDHIADILYELGTCYKDSNLEKAIACYIESAKLRIIALQKLTPAFAWKHNPIEFQVKDSLIQLGELFKIADHQKSLVTLCWNYVRLVQLVFGKSDVTDPVVSAMKKYGVLLHNLGDYNKAKSIFEEAIQLSGKCGNSQVLDLYNKAAATYHELGEDQSSLQLMSGLLKSIDNDPDFYAIVLHHLAQIQYMIASTTDPGLMAEAESNLQQAMSMFEAGGSDYEMQCGRTLARLFEATERVDLACKQMEYLIDLAIYEDDEEMEADEQFLKQLEAKRLHAKIPEVVTKEEIVGAVKIEPDQNSSIQSPSNTCCSLM